FTGNKFEFRAVGSSANCAGPMMILNTIVADQLNEFKQDVDAQIIKGVDKDEAIFKTLREYIIATKKILFEGNGYSDEWVKEAKKRGLSNVKSTPDALKIFTRKEFVKLFEKNNIMTEREQHARYEIQLETYMKKIQIESRIIGEIALGIIIPSALKYQSALIENVKGLKEIAMGSAVASAKISSKKEILAGEIYEEVGGKQTDTFHIDFNSLAGSQMETIHEISEKVSAIKLKVYKMIEARKKANAMDDAQLKANSYCENVKPYFDEIRYHSDKLEFIVDDEMWALPKYREMLFTR
ncbi:MAG TPA: hypothetical protein VII99_11580, partial [Bacteroidia bacterium]